MKSVLCALLLLASAAAAGAQSQFPGEIASRRSDPPGFGLVPVSAGQTVRLHVACYPHRIGQSPPDPCRGTFMFHSATGVVLKRGSYNLKPGQVATLEYAPGLSDGAADVAGGAAALINPCVLPDPGGRAVPTVEVIDRSTGDVALFENPAATRMSDFSNGRSNPGERVGFNPQPDPPGFGAVTVSTDQVIRMSVSCFDHHVNGSPPDPCKGSVMFHDAAGTALTDERYSLRPGESAMFEFAPMAGEVRGHVTLIPCVAPAPGGRMVPNVSIADSMTGKTSLLISPAAPAMTDFQ